MTRTISGTAVRLVPLRVGTRPVGLLVAAGRPIEPGTLDVMAGIAAIAIERARFLNERKSAEMTRQSEELKSALLASIGHDLRTPLTAIRVAAANLRGNWLSDTERRDQGDVVLTEVERLTRLFENILSMARLDAGPIAATNEWTLPSEIVIAAREQVEHTMAHHRVEVGIDADEPVRLDPELTAGALAHVLENAAQYSPDTAAIRVDAHVAGGELAFTIHDGGAGIAAAELPHLFDRFYRGGASRARASGSGMGLAIARGLLAAEGGRIWAENDPRGGAIFTISIPVEVRSPSAGAQP
jgi:two-component system sensor histidine kinase KdpD